MEAYKIHETIGDGSFGVVFKASNIKTGELVAIKKIKKKFNSWDECMSLRELKSLRKLKEHENIVKLKEVMKIKDEVHFVFEFMEQNIFQLYSQMHDSGKPFTENHIRTIIYHTASGLAYMHKHGFFHRDLKPENLLVSKGVTKIADLGLAREIRSRPPFTDYVATRWYRAPEIILKAPNYNSPVDVFALGCIMAELYLKTPLFKGSTEVEQMYKFCSVLGSPTSSTWNEGLRLAAQIGFTFPQLPSVNLATLIPNASDDAIQLMTEMLRFDPQKRPSAEKILQHPYFSGFSPSENAFLSQTTALNVPTISKQNLGLSLGSEEQQNSSRRKVSNDYLTKNLAMEEDNNHLEMLEDLGLGLDGLGLEDKYGKDNLDIDYGKDYGKDYPTKKAESNWPTTTREKSQSEGENTDDLLAEIEEYVNSNNTKQPRFSAFEDNYNPSSNTANMYSYIKPSLTGTQSTNSGLKPPIGMSNKNTYGNDISYGSKNEGYDKNSWNDSLLGPSSYDLPKNQSMAKNKSNGYLPTVSMGADDSYKYAGQNSQRSGAPQAGISNRGAQIMNTFVYSNKPGGNTGGLSGSNSQGSGLKTKIGQGGDMNNISYGQAIDDVNEGYGKYGF